jgi:hypothetical protein
MDEKDKRSEAEPERPGEAARDLEPDERDTDRVKGGAILVEHGNGIEFF